MPIAGILTPFNRKWQKGRGTNAPCKAGCNKVFHGAPGGHVVQRQWDVYLRLLLRSAKVTGAENIEIYTPHRLDASQEYSSHQERMQWELSRIRISDQNPHISEGAIQCIKYKSTIRMLVSYLTRLERNPTIFQPQVSQAQLHPNYYIVRAMECIIQFTRNPKFLPFSLPSTDPFLYCHTNLLFATIAGCSINVTIPGL